MGDLRRPIEGGWNTLSLPCGWDDSVFRFTLKTDQFSSRAKSCSTLCDPLEACQASLSITSSWSLLKLRSIKLVLPSNHLILCCPLLLMPSIFPSIRVFSKESVLHHQVAVVLELQHWSFQWIFRLISFRIDWLDLLAVQGTLKSLLQHHSSKASIFFGAQLSL